MSISTIIIITKTLVLPIGTFSSAANIIVYTSSQDTSSQKYFIVKTYKTKSANSGGKKPFHPLPSSWAASFLSFKTEWTSLVRRKWTSKCLFPRRHSIYQQKQMIKDSSNWAKQKHYTNRILQENLETIAEDEDVH